jgi:hypothetical protein
MTDEELALLELLMYQYGFSQEEAFQILAQGGGITPGAYGSEIYDTSTGGMEFPDTSSFNPVHGGGGLVGPADMPTLAGSEQGIGSPMGEPYESTVWTNSNAYNPVEPQYPADWGLDYWQDLLDQGFGGGNQSLPVGNTGDPRVQSILDAMNVGVGTGEQRPPSHVPIRTGDFPPIPQTSPQSVNQAGINTPVLPGLGRSGYVPYNYGMDPAVDQSFRGIERAHADPGTSGQADIGSNVPPFTLDDVGNEGGKAFSYGAGPNAANDILAYLLEKAMDVGRPTQGLQQAVSSQAKSTAPPGRAPAATQVRTAALKSNPTPQRTMKPNPPATRARTVVAPKPAPKPVYRPPAVIAKPAYRPPVVSKPAPTIISNLAKAMR